MGHFPTHMKGRRFPKGSQLVVVSFGIVLAMAAAVIRRRKEALLCIVSTAMTLALVEIAARNFVPSVSAVKFVRGGVSSPDFHHIYPAHAHMYMGRFEGKDVFVDTNEDGLRTTYSKEDFKKYQNRVIVLGDSFTLGMGVTSEDAFPTRLEDNLRQASGSRSIAVLNSGVISYSPFIEKLLFRKKLAAYRPTLVVLFLDATDIGDDYWYLNESRKATGASTFALKDGTPPKYRGALYELTRPYRPLLESSLAYPLELARKLAGPSASDGPARSPDYYQFKITIGSTEERNRFFIYRHPLEETRDLFDRTLRNVDEIATLAKQMGAGFALFVTPRFHHWNVKECPDNWEKGEYGLSEPYQYEYFRYFEESRPGYPVINLLPDFQATGKYPLVFRDDPHWNAAGHAFVAETVMKHMLQKKLIRQANSGAAPSR